MPKISKILLLVVSVVLVLTVFLGLNSSGVSAASDQDGAYNQINVYSEVLRHIQTDYVVDPNISSVTDGALRGLLESLDADSSYLTPEEYKIYKADKGGKAQVGINVSKRFGYATVVSIVPGSPADKVNLNDGDIIEAIGAQDTRDLSLAMIRRLLEGEPGTQVTVSVVRPRKAAPDKVELTRALVTYPAVSETMYESSSILYLKPGGAGPRACAADRGQAEGDAEGGQQEGAARSARCRRRGYAGCDAAGEFSAAERNDRYA